VAERSLAWLVGYRRLQVRYERRSDILLGFLQLAGTLICHRWCWSLGRRRHQARARSCHYQRQAAQQR
jgi:hypothetical protein